MTEWPWTKVQDSWRKAAADVPHTKTALTWLIVGLYAVVVIRTALIIKTVSDGVLIVQAMFPFVLIVLGFHFGNKGLETVRQWIGNGKPAPTPPAVPPTPPPAPPAPSIPPGG